MKGIVTFFIVMRGFVLTIAGVDPCGGAGIEADIRTISALGSHPLVVITALAVQNSHGVKGIYEIPSGVVSDQLDAIFEDVIPDSVKIGMLFSEDIVLEVIRYIERFRLENIVLDPVNRASSDGREFLMPGAMRIIKSSLLPLIDVLTPNIIEAEVISGVSIKGVEDMKRAAVVIKELGPDVVITGGHLEGECVDLLYDGNDFFEFRGQKINTPHTHGSGCVFSSALASYLSQGMDLKDAFEHASRFTKNSIRRGYPIGNKPGAVSPM